MTSPDEIRAALESPAFSHCRAGTGCWRDVTYIYHRAPKSPSGVLLACGGDSAVVEPMLRELRNTSPLSPTEFYR